MERLFREHRSSLCFAVRRQEAFAFESLSAMDQVLSTAYHLQETGHLDQAASLCQKVLGVQQENADALHLLGILHYQRGEFARAVELMSRAVALQPNAANFHCNLGEAYRSLGQFERRWLLPYGVMARARAS